MNPEIPGPEEKINFNDFLPRVHALVGGVIWSDNTFGDLPHHMFLKEALELKPTYQDKIDFLRNYLYLCAGILETLIDDPTFPPAPKQIDTVVYQSLVTLIRQVFPDAPAKFIESYKFNNPERFK